METKKSKNLDADKFRHGFFLVGLNYVAGITLAAFTYQQLSSVDKNNQTSKQNGITSYEEVEKEPILKIETPKLPPQNTPQPEIDLTEPIITVDNRNIEDTTIKIIKIDIEEPIITIIPIIEPVQDFPDVEASFIGGEEAMQKWMQENLQYPDLALEKGDKGKVYIKFVVEKDGIISNVEIIQGISRELDNEAKRLIRAMPEWKPGETKGLKVRSSFTMPIQFDFN